MDDKTRQETVGFKSWDNIFQKEKSGRKPNTLRLHDEKDERFTKLKKWHDKEVFGQIMIENKTTGETFTRQVKDITYFDKWVIISWDNEALNLAEEKHERDIKAHQHTVRTLHKQEISRLKTEINDNTIHIAGLYEENQKKAKEISRLKAEHEKVVKGMHDEYEKELDDKNQRIRKKLEEFIENVKDDPLWVKEATEYFREHFAEWLPKKPSDEDKGAEKR